MLHDWTSLLVRASVVLFLSGCGVALLMRRMPLTNPKWHRIAWGVVLLQGLMLFQFSLNIARPAWWGTTNEAVSALDVAETMRTASLSSGVATDGVQLTVSEQHSAVEDEGRIEEASSVTVDDAIIDDEAIASPSSTASPGQTIAINEETQSDPATNPASVESRSAESPDATDITNRAAVTTPSPVVATNWMDFLRWAWLAGIAVVLGVLAFNYAAMQLALTRCRPARRSWAREMHELCLELGLNHPVPLEVHPTLGPLLCWSPKRHRVVVPVGLWKQLSASERAAVLHHELCHLRRGDLWKSLIARLVVAIHWFNPIAWLSAKRFDESAEWSCDAQMAHESPGRVTRLASALLTVSEVRDPVPLLAASATGGPMFQRIRRLLSWNNQGDSLMQKCIWTGILIVFILAGGARLQFVEPQSLRADDATDSAQSAAEAADGAATINSAVVAAPEDNTSVDPRLIEMVDRIVVGDNEPLQQFVELVRTPTGQIVMADRAALAAQYAESEIDEVSLWDQFVNRHFEQRSGTWFVKADEANACQSYVDAVEVGEADILEIAGVFRLTAAELDETHPQAAIFKRFLEHESAPALIYESELKSRLHPGVEEIAEMFDDQLVRTPSGSYVIRPARRALVERRLKFIHDLGPTLGRFQQELAAWAEDLSRSDEAHRQFAEILGNPVFAEYIVFNHIYDEEPVADEDLEGMFWTLEEATDDTADGLALNRDSDQYSELMQEMERFQLIWNYREQLGAPLKQLAELIEEQDELHTQLKAVLKTDLALMSVAREMDYLPVTAAEAAREWLSYYVTQNEDGKFEITIATPEELDYLTEDGFSSFREVRRRGRIVDEFAAGLADPELQAAMQSYLGKLLLADLVERSAVRPEVDGLQVWFDQHFEESVDGLVLHDWAGDAINEVLEEAAAIEEELLNTDF